MGMLARCREPREPPPAGGEIECDVPSSVACGLAEEASISFLNCSLFIASPALGWKQKCSVTTGVNRAFSLRQSQYLLRLVLVWLVNCKASCASKWPRAPYDGAPLYLPARCAARGLVAWPLISLQMNPLQLNRQMNSSPL